MIPEFIKLAKYSSAYQLLVKCGRRLKRYHPMHYWGTCETTQTALYSSVFCSNFSCIFRNSLSCNQIIGCLTYIPVEFSQHLGPVTININIMRSQLLSKTLTNWKYNEIKFNMYFMGNITMHLMARWTSHSVECKISAHSSVDTWTY